MSWAHTLHPPVPVFSGATRLEAFSLLGLPEDGCAMLDLCLGPLKLPKQNTTDWVAYKPWKFISHHPGRWEVQVQEAGGFSVRYPKKVKTPILDIQHKFTVQRW